MKILSGFLHTELSTYIQCIDLRIYQVRDGKKHLLLKEDGEDALPLPVPHDLSLAPEAVLLEVGHPLEDGGDEVAEVLALEALRDGDLHVQGGDVLGVVGQGLKEGSFSETSITEEIVYIECTFVPEEIYPISDPTL